MLAFAQRRGIRAYPAVNGTYYGRGCFRRSRPRTNHPHAPNTGTQSTIAVHTIFAGLPCRVPIQIDASDSTARMIHAAPNHNGHVVLPASSECSGGT